MAYYFTVQKSKGNFEPLNIGLSKYFARMSKFKGTGTSIQEIDMFTMQFNNEGELRNALLDEGILSPVDRYKPLSIRFLRKGEYNKVMYDFLYQKDIEYVCFPTNLINYINSKLDDGDFRFVGEYANHFREHHDCLATASEVSRYAQDSINRNMRSKYFDIPGEEKALERMTKLLIYENSFNRDGTTTYEMDKIKYRNLHDIIAFVDHYDEKYPEAKVPNQTIQPKVKTRKKGPLPNQISFDDLLNGE